MSLTLAENWARVTIRHPTLRADALGLFQSAAAKRVTATVVLGKELVSSGRACLCRWDGLELVVHELSPEQQQAWKLEPKGMILQRDSEVTLLPVVFTDLRFSLSVDNIRLITEPTGNLCLQGACRYDCASGTRPEGRAAIQMHYFVPGLKRQRSGLSYADRFLGSPGGILPFHFSLPWLDRTDPNLRRLLAVFMQVFTADDWTSMQNCRKVSNVASALVDV